MAKKFAVVLGALLFLILAYLLWRWPPDSTSDAAAWAQAASTTAAIAFALFASHWQHSMQTGRELTAAAVARANRPEAAFQLAHYACEIGKKVAQLCRHREPDQTDLE